MWEPVGDISARFWTKVGWKRAIIGNVKMKKEILVMVYVCELSNLPFLLALESAR